jgi:hypothetical protein
MGKREALLICADTFADTTFRRLASPAVDVFGLAQVLGDQRIGGFQVQSVVNRPSHEVRMQVEQFFQERTPTDLLLLYISGHGFRDELGRLYFICADTSMRQLRATSLPAGFITEVAQDSRSKRQVLVIDSCFSGAFAKGMLLKSGGVPQLSGADFPTAGRGQVILTASTAFQYSLEGGDVRGSVQPSLFTRHLIEGLRTGDADLNGDAVVDIDELYEYLHDRTTRESGGQTPQKWSFQVEGEIHLASNPNPRKKGVSTDIRELIQHAHAGVRLQGVADLSHLLASSSQGVVLGALEELQRIAAEDDSVRVRAAAAQVLAGVPASRSFGTTCNARGTAEYGVRHEPTPASISLGVPSGIPAAQGPSAEVGQVSDDTAPPNEAQHQQAFDNFSGRGRRLWFVAFAVAAIAIAYAAMRLAGWTASNERQVHSEAPSRKTSDAVTTMGQPKVAAGVDQVQLERRDAPTRAMQEPIELKSAQLPATGSPSEVTESVEDIIEKIRTTKDRVQKDDLKFRARSIIGSQLKLSRLAWKETAGEPEGDLFYTLVFKTYDAKSNVLTFDYEFRAQNPFPHAKDWERGGTVDEAPRFFRGEAIVNLGRTDRLDRSQGSSGFTLHCRANPESHCVQGKPTSTNCRISLCNYYEGYLEVGVPSGKGAEVDAFRKAIQRIMYDIDGRPAK